ncbi:hypothetical protein [Paracidovorax wautersii]|uniref:Uncharacterized protein n=1 Tax=Paracidovorax wautersii TaxID=1177982 RepID=A0A1I2HTC3_9BURK|nr:hypothetical protein [Paracidovorax wautersii]SFF32972.1 hypothetical protein SAMN04489711_1329 [Paracidovorax wautersii]
MEPDQINLWRVHADLGRARALALEGQPSGAAAVLRESLEYLEADVKTAGPEAQRIEQIAEGLESGAIGTFVAAHAALQVQDDLLAKVPDFRVVLLDETSGWNPAIQAHAKSVFSAYLYDAKRPVHLAEITPSFELHYLFSTAENPELPDDIEEAITTVGGPEGGAVYMHARVVQAQPWDRRYVCTEPNFPDSETYDELVASEVERYRSNVPMQLPSPLGAAEALRFAEILIQRGELPEVLDMVNKMPVEQQDIVYAWGGGSRDSDSMLNGLAALADSRKAEPPDLRAARNDKANRFYDELLAQHETLGVLTETLGSRALADSMYLMACMSKGEQYDVHPGSQIVKVVSALPSAEEWLESAVFHNQNGDVVPRNEFAAERPRKIDASSPAP